MISHLTTLGYKPELVIPENDLGEPYPPRIDFTAPGRNASYEEFIRLPPPSTCRLK